MTVKDDQAYLNSACIDIETCSPTDTTIYLCRMTHTSRIDDLASHVLNLLHFLPSVDFHSHYCYFHK